MHAKNYSYTACIGLVLFPNTIIGIIYIYIKENFKISSSQVLVDN